jgi:hypothetical protein
MFPSRAKGETGLPVRCPVVVSRESSIRKTNCGSQRLTALVLKFLKNDPILTKLGSHKRPASSGNHRTARETIRYGICAAMGVPQTTALDTEEMREQAQEGISKRSSNEKLSNLTIPGNKAESVEGNTTYVGTERLAAAGLNVMREQPIIYYLLPTL